jgi:hypothetical protein
LPCGARLSEKFECIGCQTIEICRQILFAAGDARFVRTGEAIQRFGIGAADQ